MFQALLIIGYHADKPFAVHMAPNLTDHWEFTVYETGQHKDQM